MGFTIIKDHASHVFLDKSLSWVSNSFIKPVQVINHKLNNAVFSHFSENGRRGGYHFYMFVNRSERKSKHSVIRDIIYCTYTKYRYMS